MAERQVYNYTINHEDGSAFGLHEHGTGPEKTIERKFTDHFPDAYFEEQPDGVIFVFQNEDDAANERQHVGTITRILEV